MSEEANSGGKDITKYPNGRSALVVVFLVGWLGLVLFVHARKRREFCRIAEQLQSVIRKQSRVAHLYASLSERQQTQQREGVDWQFLALAIGGIYAFVSALLEASAALLIGQNLFLATKGLLIIYFCAAAILATVAMILWRRRQRGGGRGDD